MINVLEDEVRALHRDLRSKDAGFCACERCESDVVTLALNNARPRYVSDQVLGGAVTRTSLSDQGQRTALLVIVYDAMRQVAQRPRHDGAPAEGAAT